MNIPFPAHDRPRAAGGTRTARILAAALALVLVAALTIVLGAATATDAAAQAGTGNAPGEVLGAELTGTVHNGSAGGTEPTGARVQLITLDGDGEITTLETTVGVDGRYRFDLPADPDLTHLPRVVFRGVQYIGQPVLLGPELPEAEQDFTVYDTTTEPPPLTIVSTVATVLLIERAAGEIAFVREDIVHNPTDRVFTAPEGEATLRLPLADRTIEGIGLSEEGTFTVVGQTLQTDAPLRPGDTVVVTRHVVGYDPAADGYRLRLTAPLETASATVRVPERFAAVIEALEPARRSGTGELEGEPLALLSREALTAGQSVVVELQGFVPRNDPNPLTEPWGAAAAALIVIAVVGALAWVVQRRTPPEPPTAAPGERA